jgi:hypothetical protein
VLLEKDGEDHLDRSCERNEVLRTIKKEKHRTDYKRKEGRKANWISHILHRNCLLKNIEGEIGGGIEVTGRQGRRRKQLLADLQETTGYWRFKEEIALCGELALGEVMDV